MKKRVFLIILSVIAFCCSVSAQNASAQYAVEGTVVDSLSGSPVGYATVAVLKSDSSLITAAAADGAGRFSVGLKEDGSYRLQISSVGYATVDLPFAVDGKKVDVGTIRMTQGIEIENVVVAVQKPLIVADDEKIAYNVDADPETPTSQLVDIIRKIPQLSVDGEGNVLLNGQSDYKILVNGRSSSMMSKNFKNVIESMPAGAIKSIEVITNPSTKYEAEGVGGIINIITNRQITGGYNGSVNLSGSTRRSLGGNLYMAAQLGKLNLSASAYYSSYKARKSYDAEYEQEIFDNEAMNRVLASARGKYKGVYSGINLNASYEFDTLNLLTVEAGFSFGRSHNNSLDRTDAYSSTGDLTMGYGTDNRMKSSYDSYTASANYQHTFNRTDHTLTVSYDMELDPDSDNTTYDIIDAVNYTPYSRHNFGDNGAFGSTVQIDYFNPINDRHSIEAGTKYIYRDYTNNSVTSIRDEETGQYVADPTYPHSDMDYTQKIFALYAGYQIKGKKISGRVGARMEQAWSDVTVKTEKGDIGYAPSLFDVIPYMSLNYRPDDSNTLSLSFTQRLRRPNLWNMNPYRDESSPLSVSYGNPDLDATTSNSLSLSWRKFTSAWTLSFGVNGIFSNNAVNGYSFVEEGVTHHTYGNIATSQGYSFNGTVGYRSGIKFNATVSFRGGYDIIDAKEFGLHNEGFSYNASANISAALWKNASIFCNGYVYRFSPSLEQTNDRTFVFYGIGLRQQFFKQKFTVSLSSNNPFSDKIVFKTSIETPTYRSSSRSVQYMRSFSFSLGYRFGKTQVNVKSTNRSINNDDMDSSGKGGSGGGVPGGM